MRSSRTRALVLVVALVGLTELATATAHADAVDDAFLNAVRSHGINFASPQAAIMARSPGVQCARFRQAEVRCRW